MVLWLVGLLTLGVMRFAFPAWQGGSFFSTTLVSEPTPPDWLELFVPSNPFWALANNLVPAVVLFCLGLGVALIPIPNKERLLDSLDVLLDGLARLNKLIVQLSPIGIFAIVGYTAGTMSVEQLSLLQGYLLVYGGAAVLLCCLADSRSDCLLHALFAARRAGGIARCVDHRFHYWKHFRRVANDHRCGQTLNGSDGAGFRSLLQRAGVHRSVGVSVS